MKVIKNNSGDVFAVVTTLALLNEHGSIYGYYDTVTIQKDRGLSCEENNFLWDYCIKNRPEYTDVWDQYYWEFKEVDYDEFHNLLEENKCPV